MEHFRLVGIAVALFASTDIDDLFVLLSLFADRKFQVYEVVVGQYLGLAGLYGASVLAALISCVVSTAYIGVPLISVPKVPLLYPRNMGKNVGYIDITC